jgi:hypothetical protein
MDSTDPIYTVFPHIYMHLHLKEALYSFFFGIYELPASLFSLFRLRLEDKHCDTTRVDQLTEIASK